MAVLQKMFIRSLQMTNRGFMRMSSKQIRIHHVSLRRQANFKESNGVCGKSTSKPMVACFFGKTGHVATVPLKQSTVDSEWYTTISLKKFEKRTRQDESLFTMAMLVLAHRLKSAPFWASKISNWWVSRRTALTWNPNGFFLFPQLKKILRAQRFSSNSNFC